LVDTADGKMQSLAAPRGPFEGLRVSSDKTQLSYVGARVDGPAPHDLFAQSLSGGAPRNLSSAPLDRPVEAYEWQTDGKLLALTGDGFRGSICWPSSSRRWDQAPNMLSHPRRTNRELF